MSGTGARLVVVPTVTVLGMIKIRLIAAKKGHQLLKKKARPAWEAPPATRREAAAVLRPCAGAVSAVLGRC